MRRDSLRHGARHEVGDDAHLGHRELYAFCLGRVEDRVQQEAILANHRLHVEPGFLSALSVGRCARAALGRAALEQGDSKLAQEGRDVSAKLGRDLGGRVETFGPAREQRVRVAFE